MTDNDAVFQIVVSATNRLLILNNGIANNVVAFPSKSTVEVAIFSPLKITSFMPLAAAQQEKKTLKGKKTQEKK